MADTIVRPGRKLAFIEKEIHLNQHADNWTRIVTTRLNALSLHNVTEGNRISVCTLADLPAPVDSVITLEDETLYEVCGPVLDVEDNQIVFGFDSWLQGQKKFLTEIVGTTSVPLFVSNGSSALKCNDITMRQLGTGDLCYLDSTITDQANRFVDCIFFGGDIRGVDGLGMLFTACVFDEGCQVIQDGSGGVDIVDNSGGSLLVARPGFPPRDGIFKFESGSSTNILLIDETAIQLANASIGINFEDGCQVGQLTMNETVLVVFGTGGTLIQVANPNSISIGAISDAFVTLVGPNDRFLACAPVVSGTLEPASIDDPVGVTQDGDGNLIYSDTGTDTIYRCVGISATPMDNITAPASDTGSLAWFKGDLYSLDTVTNLIYQHVGFTTTTTNITAPASDPSGVVFVGNDLVSADKVTNLIYIHDGFTTSVTSFTSPASATMGIAFDGINLLIGDASDNSIYVMRGVTSEVQYKFTSSVSAQEDIWVTLDRSTNEVGFVVIDSSADEIAVYDNPVTFDHSSSSWELMDNLGFIGSSDRGGAQFLSSTKIEVDTATGVWRDISATGIFYGGFSESEKMALNDEENGEILWLSTRTRGRIISAQVTAARGGPTQDIEYGLAIAINGVVQKDSITFGIIPTSLATLTMSTLNISRDLKKDDLVKIQILRNNGTDSSDPQVGFSKLAIT